MAKRSAIDTAIEQLDAKKLAILATAKAEAAALDSAILALRAQRVTRRLRPRAVAQKQESA